MGGDWKEEERGKEGRRGEKRGDAIKVKHEWEGVTRRRGGERKMRKGKRGE